MAQQQKEAPEAIVQGRLLKIIGAVKLLDSQSAMWCVAHAIPGDLRKLADDIEASATKSK